MSALPPKADIRADEIDVRFVPLATIVQCVLARRNTSVSRINPINQNSLLDIPNRSLANGSEAAMDGACRPFRLTAVSPPPVEGQHQGGPDRFVTGASSQANGADFPKSQA
jgi:hypothetical protein